MDWGGVIKDLALNGATTFATALGGPLAGDVVQRLGKALLGKDDATPAEVQNAVTNLTGDQIVALKKADLEYRQHLADNGVQWQIAEINSQKDVVVAVNTTMQAEAKAEHWPTYSWRPYNGFVFPTLVVLDYFLLPLLSIKPPEIPNEVWLAFGGILGVASWFRGSAQANPNIPTDNRG